MCEWFCGTCELGLYSSLVQLEVDDKRDLFHFAFKEKHKKQGMDCLVMIDN